MAHIRPNFVVSNKITTPMIEMQGKYGKDCRVFIDQIEDTARGLIQDILDNPAFADSKVRIMPDTHAGTGIVIGFTSPLRDYVCPGHVGVDIGCTIDCWVTDASTATTDLVRLESDIRRAVRFGQEYHACSVVDEGDFYRYANGLLRTWHDSWPEMIQPVELSDKYVTDFCRRIGINTRVFWTSLGTVGGGNHFIEVGEHPETHCLVYTIHCGSRNLGLKIAKYHERIASNPQKGKNFKEELDCMIRDYKAAGRDREISDAISQFTQTWETTDPTGYLSGREMSDYLTDMAIGVAYAQYNHEVISRLVLEALRSQHPRAKVTEVVRSIHNYVDFTDHTIRKGAIRAYEGELCVIPFNMRDGLAICRGKSNPDWNCSAPHGAGRVMSRAQAKKNLSVEAFAEQMQGIVSTSVGVGTIDEAPDAYKPAALIRQLIRPTVDILYLIRPLINLKDKNTAAE